MTDPQKEAKWQKFVESAFKTAKLPEVKEEELEIGTYTNAQVAEKFRDDPLGLLKLLMGLSKMGGGNASRRSILSFAVDMIEEKDQKPSPV